MAWTNLVFIYNGNINDRNLGTARFEVRDFQTKLPAAKPNNFEFGQLKKGGGVFRWHYVVTLIVGRDYEIRVTRLGVTGNWLKFRGALNQSVTFQARRLGVW